MGLVDSRLFGTWGFRDFGTLERFSGFCDSWSLGLSDFCVVELSGFGTSDFESFLYLCTFGFELSDFGTWDFGIFWLFDFLFFFFVFWTLCFFTTQIIKKHFLTIYAAITIFDF